MAAYRRRCLVVLLSIFNLSLIAAAGSQEAKLPGGQDGSASFNPQKATETVEQKAEQRAEERRWEETEVGNTAAGDAANEKMDTFSHEHVSPSRSSDKDDFREELVLRPLHSGDIYASFQFRTLWKTDFRENKGKLAVIFCHVVSDFNSKKIFLS